MNDKLRDFLSKACLSVRMRHTANDVSILLTRYVCFTIRTMDREPQSVLSDASVVMMSLVLPAIDGRVESGLWDIRFGNLWRIGGQLVIVLYA